MIKRGFTVTVDTSVRDAIKVLDENDCNSLVVLKNKKTGWNYYGKRCVKKSYS